MAKSREYRAPGAIKRLPGEKWADFNARQIADREAKRIPVKVKRVRRAKAKPVESYETRGDDIGLSPDL